MKKLTKILSLALVAVMLIGMFAITATAAEGTGSITITNAAKGETYSIVRLFDADIDGKQDGPIVYKAIDGIGIPASLAAYFTVDPLNQTITCNDNHLTQPAIEAMKAWAETQTPTATMVADTNSVVFDNLEYGYYIVISSQGAAISVNSTNPDVEILDKNSTVWYIEKAVNDPDVYIGQTVTYTLTTHTANYFYNAGTPEAPIEPAKVEKVTKYVINDTLPAYLTNVTVTGITVTQPSDVNNHIEINKVGEGFEQFGEDKAIEIKWIDEAGEPLYENKSVITITYTAYVSDQAIIDGDGNLNEMTVELFVDDGDGERKKEEKKDYVVINTYALGLRKTDNTGKALAGATFRIDGLQVAGSKGMYTVVKYDPATIDAANSTVMETDDLGNLIIMGLASDTPLSVIEVKAPDGYNKLKDAVQITPRKTGTQITATHTTIYYDENGNVTETVTESTGTKVVYTAEPQTFAVEVQNVPGTELPETGGVGTTMFIVFGSLVALMSAVVLVARKKTAGYR